MDQAAARRPRSWRTSALLFAALLGIYSANGREIGAVDTVPNILLPVAILRGDGLVLNRFEAMLREWEGGELPYYAKERGGEVISRYPVFPALVALPPTWAQLALLDRLLPSWVSEPTVSFWWMRTMAKNSAALVAALTALLLHRLLLHLKLGEVAVATTLATALGSELWMVASQSAWQHGPTALFLVLSLLLLVPAPAPRWRLVGAGLAVAAAVCARPTSVVFAAPLALWAVASLGRRALWFLVPAAAIGALLIGHHLSVFGSIVGGLGEIERLGHEKHALTGSLTSEPFGSLAGTLLSPNRGLFVFSPWVLLALGALPATARKLAPFPPLRAALIGLLPFTLVLSWYGVWWAGWSFGPRYWAEAMPLFGVLLGFALVWARERSRPALVASRAAILFSVALQAIGAFCYPSSWNSNPVTVDLHHERLWDWRDSEIRRCLEEGPHWPTSYEIVRRRLAG